MSTLTENTSSQRSETTTPAMHTVTPHLICTGAADAIDFYKRAFNAAELVRMPTPGGKLMHACLRIGDSNVMLVDEFPEWGSFSPRSLKGTPVTIHLTVLNADATVEQAVTAGAKIVMPLQDMFWGDRYGIIEDPFGHRWSIAHHVRDVTPEEAMKAAKEMGACAPDPSS